jgi:hypothetical protein
MKDTTEPVQHCCDCAKAEDAVNVSAWGICGDDRGLSDAQAMLRSKAINYLENRFRIPILDMPKFEA